MAKKDALAEILKMLEINKKVKTDKKDVFAEDRKPTDLHLGPQEFMLVNIAWNDYQWREVQDGNRTDFRALKGEDPPHECLNFDFNKRGANGEAIDQDSQVRGYFQSHKEPKRFWNGGLVFFYSTNPNDGNGYIVGVYGKVRLTYPIYRCKYEGFENDEFWANMWADTSFSSLFKYPYLDTFAYRSWYNRMVPMVNFRYIVKSLAVKILEDEIEACKNSNDKEIKEKIERILDYAISLGP